ncbi:MAG: hypothetical protein QOH13_2393 [Thermoleophilaceae bacterium]|jgi:hypothetical protein|nr:hypothetical protein [Thermoleophilaceae bacterium]
MTCYRPSVAVHALACAGIACLLAGCGSSSSRTASTATTIARQAAAQLAGQTRVVESRLAQGDDCGAVAAVQTLRRQATRAIASRDVPPALAQPLGRSIDALASQITCTPQPAAPSAGNDKEQHDKKRHDKKQHDNHNDEGGD